MDVGDIWAPQHDEFFKPKHREKWFNIYYFFEFKYRRCVCMFSVPCVDSIQMMGHTFDTISMWQEKRHDYIANWNLINISLQHTVKAN